MRMHDLNRKLHVRELILVVKQLANSHADAASLINID